MSALTTQVAGSHYKEMAIQPVEFAMANNWDFCASSALKYVVRHAGKAGRQDLEKAIHFAALRAELVRGVHLRGIHSIDIEDFISANGITDKATGCALRSLSKWVYSSRDAVFGAFGRTCHDAFVAAVNEMIHDHYPTY